MSIYLASMAVILLVCSFAQRTPSVAIAMVAGSLAVQALRLW